MRFVLGPADSTSGLRMAESLHARCAGLPIDVVAIEGAGQFPHLEKPAATVDAIRSWRAGGY